MIPPVLAIALFRPSYLSGLWALDHWHLTEGEWTLERLVKVRYQQVAKVDAERLQGYSLRFRSQRLDRAGREWMVKVKRDLTLAGFDPEATWNDRKVVHTGWVGLAGGLLRDAGLSALSAEKLAIMVEIDTHPPDGARCERRVVTRHVTFLLQHYDLPSLLAGKLHAVMTRKYAKCRDWYDLVWYLSQRPPVEPNVSLLQNALDQTQGVGHFDANAWKELVQGRLAALNLQTISDDVSPFLERPQDAALLTRENLKGLLQEE